GLSTGDSPKRTMSPGSKTQALMRGPQAEHERGSDKRRASQNRLLASDLRPVRERFDLASGRAVLALLRMGATLFGCLLAPTPHVQAEPAGPFAQLNPTVSPAPALLGQDARQYEAEVRPFLARYCFECHGVEKPKGDLRLDLLRTDFSEEDTREKWQI